MNVRRGQSRSLSLALGALSVVVAMVQTGCTTSYRDDLVESVRVPEGWTPIPVARLSVPGDILNAWEGPAGARLVLYKALPAPQATARALADEYANRLENLPGVTSVTAEVRQHGINEVAYVTAVLPGDGRSMAPSGLGTPVVSGHELVPTSFIACGLPRPQATYWLTVYLPASEHDRLRSEVNEIMSGWPNAVSH